MRTAANHRGRSFSSAFVDAVRVHLHKWMHLSTQIVWFQSFEIESYWILLSQQFHFDFYFDFAKFRFADKSQAKKQIRWLVTKL